MTHPFLSVIVPCLNEERNVRPLYERLAATLDPMSVEWELIFSMDPSTDRTEEVIRDLRALDPRVKTPAPVAPLRAARGHDGRPAHVVGRRGRRDRLRSPGSPRADRAR